jgi:hypothetical protein
MKVPSDSLSFGKLLLPLRSRRRQCRHSARAMHDIRIMDIALESFAAKSL